MSDRLRELELAHDGPIPRHEYFAARYGYRAHERLTVCGDMSIVSHNARCYAIALKKAIRDQRAGRGDPGLKATLLLRCQQCVAQWRRYRRRYREIMLEIAAVQAAAE